MADDLMDWTPATPPTPHPIGEFPARTPTAPLAPAQVRLACPTWLSSAAKRVCTVASILGTPFLYCSNLVGQSVRVTAVASYNIVREYNLRNRRDAVLRKSSPRTRARLHRQFAGLQTIPHKPARPASPSIFANPQPSNTWATSFSQLFAPPEPSTPVAQVASPPSATPSDPTQPAQPAVGPLIWSYHLSQSDRAAYTRAVEAAREAGTDNSVAATTVRSSNNFTTPVGSQSTSNHLGASAPKARSSRKRLHSDRWHNNKRNPRAPEDLSILSPLSEHTEPSPTPAGQRNTKKLKTSHDQSTSSTVDSTVIGTLAANTDISRLLQEHRRARLKKDIVPETTCDSSSATTKTDAATQTDQDIPLLQEHRGARLKQDTVPNTTYEKSATTANDAKSSSSVTNKTDAATQTDQNMVDKKSTAPPDSTSSPLPDIAAGESAATPKNTAKASDSNDVKITPPFRVARLRRPPRRRRASNPFINFIHSSGAVPIVGRLGTKRNCPVTRGPLAQPAALQSEFPWKYVNEAVTQTHIFLNTYDAAGAQLQNELDESVAANDDAASSVSSNVPDSWQPPPLLPGSMPAQKKQEVVQSVKGGPTEPKKGVATPMKSDPVGSVEGSNVAKQEGSTTPMQSDPVGSVKGSPVTTQEGVAAPMKTENEPQANTPSPKKLASPTKATPATVESDISSTYPFSASKTPEDVSEMIRQYVPPSTPSKFAPGSDQSDISSTFSAHGKMSPYTPTMPDPRLVELDQSLVDTPSESSTSSLSPSLSPRAMDALEQEVMGTRSPSPSTPVKQIQRLHVSDPRTPTETEHTPKHGMHAGEMTARRTRGQQKLIDAEASARKYKILPLPTKYHAIIEAAVKSGHGKLAAADFARVCPPGAAAGSSFTDNWLNDEVINAYLDLVVKHGKQNDRDLQVPSHHAFNSFFYSNLEKKGYDSVKRWAIKGKIGGKKLLDTKFVFIPINSSAHWTLCVVSGVDRTIKYYNSLPGEGRAHLSRVKEWVKAELGNAYKEEEWSVGPAFSSQQANSDDCGVFTITNARQLMLGLPLEGYAAGDIPLQRKRVVAELVEGALIKGEE